MKLNRENADSVLDAVAYKLGCDTKQVERVCCAFARTPYSGRYIRADQRLLQIRRLLGIYGTSKDILEVAEDWIQERGGAEVGQLRARPSVPTIALAA